MHSGCRCRDLSNGPRSRGSSPIGGTATGGNDRDIRPDGLVHRLREASNARLDAAVDLLALYQALNREQAAARLTRELEDRVRELTEILFSGKGDAYGRNDLPSILRYHSTLH